MWTEPSDLEDESLVEWSLCHRLDGFSSEVEQL